MGLEVVVLLDLEKMTMQQCFDCGTRWDTHEVHGASQCLKETLKKVAALEAELATLKKELAALKAENATLKAVKTPEEFEKSVDKLIEQVACLIMPCTSNVPLAKSNVLTAYNALDTRVRELEAAQKPNPGPQWNTDAEAFTHMSDEEFEELVETLFSKIEFAGPDDYATRDSIILAQNVQAARVKELETVCDKLAFAARKEAAAADPQPGCTTDAEAWAQKEPQK